MLAALAAALTASAQLSAMPSAQDNAPLADCVAADTKDVKPSGTRKFKCVWTFANARDEKIKAYANDCLTRHPADYPRSRRIPFIAVTRGNWCENKTTADVERELNDLLDAGVDEICAFEMTAIIDDPELYALFLKYCGKD